MVYEIKQKDVKFDDEICQLLIIRDIQEVSKVEYARSLEKLTEIMIASTSHDMRTPLNTTTNMLQLIKTRTTDEQTLQWLEVCKRSTNQLLYLVNDTLDYF